jgi:hypothetical protein
MKKPSILITSIGSRAAEGILNCLEPIRGRIRVIATNTVAQAPGLYDVDVAYLVPPTAQDAAFRQGVSEIIEAEAVDLVVSGRDEEVVALAQLSGQQRAAPCLFLVPPADLAPIFNDKYRTAQFAQEHGLPFVSTAYSADEVNKLIAKTGYPLVAKPRVGGHASRGVYILTSSSQLEVALAHGGFVFQPFVQEPGGSVAAKAWDGAMGTPWGWSASNTYHRIDLVLGRRGELVAQCVSKVECDGSLVKRLELLDLPTLRAVAIRHADVLGACGHRGPVNIQGVVLADGSFTAFEWNARFVGSAPGYALLGENQVVAALRHFLPELADLPERAPSNATVFRPLVFRAVSSDVIDSLRQNGCWRATDSASGAV